MSIDAKMLSAETYADRLRDWVNVVLFRVYEDLSEMHFNRDIVDLTDLIEFTYSDVFVEVRDNMIGDSLSRNEHEEYGLTKEQYIAQCYNGQIENESVVPYIEQSVLRSKIIEAINENQLFVQDGAHFENQPIIGVW